MFKLKRLLFALCGLGYLMLACNYQLPFQPPPATFTPEATLDVTQLTPVADYYVALHEVAAGETLADISRHYIGSPRGAEAIGMANGGVTELQVGQQLQVVIYVIQPGDTWNSIAERFDVTIEELLTGNTTEILNLLHPGVKLIIPKAIPMP